MALAVAGLSTAAFAQTNVTIYGVADVSAQGTNMSQGVNPSTKPSGGSFNMKSNSSLIGFKGTEDLGNGLKAMFQVETNVNLTGTSGNQGVTTSGTTFGSMRDSYVGASNKYGTVMGGYLSTPYRSALTSFDVMPGATGDGRIETLMGRQNWGGLNSSVRASAIAYAMPTLYGFNGSIAYTGSNNNGDVENINSANLLQSAMSLNLGWAGYGVAVKGAFQQAKVNGATAAGTVNATTNPLGLPFSQTGVSGYTSYLIGASYTGIPGLKASVVYNRNTVGTNNSVTSYSATNGYDGWNANKGSNNQIYAGVAYRFGNNEPRLAYANSSNTNFNGGNANDGASQWSLGWGYYLSKRTQVYGIASTIKNNQDGTNNFASGGSSLVPTGGQKLLTYGAGLRTNF
ncbi:MAG: porin [Fluviibacter phosphoraccumulans]